MIDGCFKRIGNSVELWQFENKYMLCMAFQQKCISLQRQYTRTKPFLLKIIQNA